MKITEVTFYMRRFLCVVLFLFFSLCCLVSADDIDLTKNGQADIPVNVLFLIDNSLSMTTIAGPVGQYDPSINYMGIFKPGFIYYLPHHLSHTAEARGQNKPPVFSSKTFNKLICTDPLKQSTIYNKLKTSGFWKGELFAPSSAKDDNLYCSIRAGCIRLPACCYYGGNYLNWWYESRLNITKRLVISEVLAQEKQVRFGVAVFNDTAETGGVYADNGGTIISEIGNPVPDLINSVSSISAISVDYSPLAETLAETGIYFAGKASWYNHKKYTSPIAFSCQKNVVVIISDGASWNDPDHRLLTSSYLNKEGDPIGDYDRDDDDVSSSDSFGAGYLDDVSAYLYRNDIRPDQWDDSGFIQNIYTYTIGLNLNDMTGNLSGLNQNMLKDTAHNGHGSFFNAASANSLRAAVEATLNDILINTGSFFIPSVPMASQNPSYHGANAYLSMFGPSGNGSGRWVGNIKKFAFNKSPSVPVADTSLALGGYTDLWTQTRSDKVTTGGVRQKMQGQEERFIFTHVNNGSRRIPFSCENIGALASYGLNDEMIQDLITGNNFTSGDLHGGGSDFEGYWILGDIIHSTPKVHRYGDGTEVLFSGANDGMMHCFNADSGIERWAYIPEHQLSRLPLLFESASHHYFIDGEPCVYTYGSSEDPTVLLGFGERRGGHRYVFLDITDNDEAPSLKYVIGNDDMPGHFKLGQSWSTPKIVSVMDCSAPEERQVDVMFLGGGYDTNQDRYGPSGAPKDEDSRGQGVLMVNPKTGEILEILTHPDMTHGIIDAISFDPGYLKLADAENPSIQKGAHSRLYAADLRGNLFGFKDDSHYVEGNRSDYSLAYTSGKKDGVFGNGYFLFESEPRPSAAPPGKKGDGAAQFRKVFFRPEVVLETFKERRSFKNGKGSFTVFYHGEYIFWGTGDRAHPSRTDTVNRFYGIKNCWDRESDNPLRINETVAGSIGGDSAGLPVIMDVTDDPADMGRHSSSNASFSTTGTDEAEIIKIRRELASFHNRGWFLNFENPGEKLMSSPVAFMGMVLFTTYTPRGSGYDPAGEDLCQSSGEPGDARLYALNYQTGGAVLDHSGARVLRPKINGINPEKGKYQDGGGSATGCIEEAKKVNALHREDRCKIIGRGIPSKVNIIFTKDGGVQLMIGVGGAVYTRRLDVPEMQQYYWRERL